MRRKRMRRIRLRKERNQLRGVMLFMGITDRASMNRWKNRHLASSKPMRLKQGTRLQFKHCKSIAPKFFHPHDKKESV